MPRIVSGLLACFLTFSACLSAAELKGKITDPSGAPVPGAQVAVVNRVGVVAQTTAGASGGSCWTLRKLRTRGWWSPLRVSDTHTGAR